jgi:NitT/TauT family transport system substrate-binding protein
MLAALLSVVALVGPACSGSAARAKGSEEVLRLGIFPNLTHAPGHVAVGAGIFERVLAPTKVEVTVFNSGTDAGQALLSGSIDATYIGPGPTAELFLRSQGEVVVVSGVASGGASLVVNTESGITGPEDLAGKKIAVPGLGNTQDVALRTWLHDQGLETKEEGGPVTIVPVDNPELPQLFRSGDLDAAWEPEPYPSYLVDAGVAEVLVDEADLWPDGRFVTTNLLVSKTYLGEHPAVVEKLVRANVEAIQMIADEPDEARRIASEQLIASGAPELGDHVIDQAWGKLEITWDPVASSMVTSASNAFELGYLDEDPGAMTGLYQLDVLNEVLADMGLEPVEAS